jgi:hypothetical protein
MILRPFDICRFKRDIPKLEHLWIKLLTHAASSRSVIPGGQSFWADLPISDDPSAS